MKRLAKYSGLAFNRHPATPDGSVLFQYPQTIINHTQGGKPMEFFNSAITVLQTLVVALGAGLGIWGAINLLEGYGNDNPGAKSQGMKQLMAN